MSATMKLSYAEASHLSAMAWNGGKPTDLECKRGRDGVLRARPQDGVHLRRLPGTIRAGEITSRSVEWRRVPAW